jgi:hypothetical protein
MRPRAGAPVHEERDPMNELIARGKPRETTIEAVITRANGDVEDLGVVAYWHRRRLKRWAWALRQRLASR